MTLYFNGAVDNDWDELGNWWEELDGVDGGSSDVAASALPTSSDDVVLLTSVDMNGGSDPTVANLEVREDYAYIAIGITVTGLATFSRDYSHNVGTITGDCVFSGYSSYNNGTITGDCVFSGFYSYNNGTITGDCVFSGFYSYNNNNGTITGDCVFSGDYSHTLGTITGDCVFSGDYSYNDYGTITGDCEFSGEGSYNYFGYVFGVVTFRNLSSIIATFYNTAGNVPSFNNQPQDFKFPFADVLGGGLL
jgi:hypothetical protein